MPLWVVRWTCTYFKQRHGEIKIWGKEAKILTDTKWSRGRGDCPRAVGQSLFLTVDRLDHRRLKTIPRCGRIAGPRATLLFLRGPRFFPFARASPSMLWNADKRPLTSRRDSTVYCLSLRFRPPRLSRIYLSPFRVNPPTPFCFCPPHPPNPRPFPSFEKDPIVYDTYRLWLTSLHARIERQRYW